MWRKVKVQGFTKPIDMQSNNERGLASDFCEQNVVANEYFPDHGCLATELRQYLQSRLHKDPLPTTAICSMTLELRIDIGKVNSFFQEIPTHSCYSR